MRVQLNSTQWQMISSAGISAIPEKEYSEDEAFDLLEQVHDAEVRYAQDADENVTAKEMANAFAVIADAIQNQIPEE